MKLPDNMANLLASSYSVLRPTAPTADMVKKPAVTPAVAAAPKPVDPFAGMKSGESRDFRSWTGNQVGGMTVVGGKGSGAGSLDNYLTRGYKPNEALAMLSAVGGYDQNQSGARLNDVKAGLMPGETAASIAQMQANAGLIGQQAKWFGPTAQANIGLTNANTADVKNTTDINYRTNNIPALTQEEARALLRTGRTTAPNIVGADATAGAMQSLGLVRDANGVYRFAS